MSLNRIDEAILAAIGMDPKWVTGLRYHRDRPEDLGSIYVECLILEDGQPKRTASGDVVVESLEWVAQPTGLSLSPTSFTFGSF